jgi:hypothetical protein
MNANILARLVDEDDFERIRDIQPENVEGLETYEAFVEWNTNCVNEFSARDVAWAQTLIGICAMLRHGQLKMVDMESCGEWTAGGFYFNAKKELVIAHPR